MISLSFYTNYNIPKVFLSRGASTTGLIHTPFHKHEKIKTKQNEKSKKYNKLSIFSHFVTYRGLAKY